MLGAEDSELKGTQAVFCSFFTRRTFTGTVYQRGLVQGMQT